MNLTTVISECGTYRYVLARGQHVEGGKTLCFIMVNPSTAGHTVNDPTIRSCVRLSKALGYGGRIVVINLYALRTPNVEDLRTHHDPVGPENDEWIAQVLRHPALDFVAAWGTNVKDPMHRARKVREMVRLAGRELHCFGKNKDGSPKHPLFLSSTAPLGWLK